MGREPLSAERVIGTAVRLADELGATELTLRKLAGELRVHVTSIYNHIPSFDAVLDGMVEQLLVDAKLPVAADLRWERWVEQLVDGMSNAAATHPGAFGVLLQRPVQGAEAAATYEAGMAAFRRAGLDPATAYEAVRTVALAAIGAGAERAARALGKRTRSDVTDLPPDRFPHLRDALSHARSDDGAFLAATLVAGLRSHIRRAKQGSA